MFKMSQYNNAMTKTEKKDKRKDLGKHLLAFIEQQLSFERYIIFFLEIIIGSFYMCVPFTHNSW